jgi:hypothetical protein
MAESEIKSSSDVTSAGSGAWQDKSTWNDDKVPKSGDEVTIRSVDTVTLDGKAKGHTLTVDGTLTGSGKIDAWTVNGSGTIEASGGVLEVKGAVDAGSTTTSFLIDASSTLEFDGPVGSYSNTPVVTFNGPFGVLDLTGENKHFPGFDGAIANFAATDQIAVDGSKGDTVSFVQGTGGTGALEIKDQAGHTVDTIKLDGNYSPGDFHISSFGGVDVITTTAICFMAGTLIRTPAGETAVETLKRGDLVVTADGLSKPIVWLGRQTISTIFADPLRVWPIRIRAGAIDENVPARDLILSPGHAVLVGGSLVLASALVNGASVVRESTVPKVFTYFHIELDDHCLVLAENTPAETFVDNVDRLAFDNWDEHEALYPNGKAIVELPYPVAKSRRQIPVDIRVKLGERALRFGAASDAA